jgi:hypothetical protein
MLQHLAPLHILHVPCIGAVVYNFHKEESPENVLIQHQLKYKHNDLRKRNIIIEENTILIRIHESY